MSKSADSLQAIQARKRRLYSSALWRYRVRPAVLDRDLTCQCQDPNCWLPTYVVAHIVPIEQGGADVDMGNLRGLSWPCHIKSTAEREKQ